MLNIIIAIIVVFIVPIGGAVYLKNKKKVEFKNFIIGALTFLISQVLIRLPILKYLEKNTLLFTTGALSGIVIQILFYSFTAGIFEETGRFISYKTLLKKEENVLSPISFGLGHGGFEAMYVFTPLIINGLMHPLIFGNLGYFGLLERLYSIIVHISLSIIIFLGVKKGRSIYLLYGIFLHGLSNFIIIHTAQITRNTLLVTVIGFIIGLIYLAIAIYGLKNYSKEVVKDEKEN